jgi:hypothetical protein
MKQIVRESNTMRELGYDINIDTDDKLTDIFQNNFYSCSHKLFLKLGYNPVPGTYVALVEDGTRFVDSLLLKVTASFFTTVPYNHNTNAILGICEVHRDKDKKNIGGRPFAEWVYT